MRRDRITALLTALVLALMLPLSALAAGGDGSGGGKGKGDGSGGGGGSGTPLAVSSIDPADGAEDVSLTPEIQCVFTHNVTQGELTDRNLELLSLETADGEPVPVVTWAEDAQVDPEERTNLYLKPETPLEPGVTYVVRVAAGVEAKNGMVTEEEETFSFTTQAPENQEPAADEAESSGSSWAVTAVVVVIVAAAVVGLVLRSRKKKQ